MRTAEFQLKKFRDRYVRGTASFDQTVVCLSEADLEAIKREEAQHILKLVDAKVGPDFAKKVALDTIRQRIQELSETPAAEVEKEEGER